MKKMEIETAGASGSWKGMETEMESGSWKEMEMETEMGTEMMASEAIASRTANRSVCNPQRHWHRTPSTHGMTPSLRDPHDRSSCHCPRRMPRS